MAYNSPISSTTTKYPPRAVAITPHDTNALVDQDGTEQAMTVFVGSAGTVAVLPAGNTGTTAVTFTIPAGGVVPVLCRVVKSTGTTASGLVGVW